MARPRVGKRRKDHREVVYLSEDVHAKMAALLREYTIIESKSRLIEKALEYFVDQVNQRGLDWNWRPKELSLLPTTHGERATTRPARAKPTVLSKKARSVSGRASPTLTAKR